MFLILTRVLLSLGDTHSCLHEGIRPGFPDLRLGSKDYWRKGFRRRGWARGWVAQLRKDPTGGRGDDESSKAPEWIEPEGGADWFQEKK